MQFMLTESQTRSAIDYNKRAQYTTDEIKVVQAVVGAVVDGLWGPETVNKVAVWQDKNSLKVDGKVGPQTYGAIKAVYDSVNPCPPDKPLAEVGCGLAAYDQSWPGHTTDEALQKAWDTALAEGCKELRFWSSEWLVSEKLANGGNKGNTYSGPWLAKQCVPEDVVVGAWIDDPVSNARTAGFADHLVERHITRAAIMVNRSNTRPSDAPWALRWKRDDLEKVAALYHAKGIECVATCWPQPDKSQIDAMCEDMKWILSVLGSNVFEVDTEGNWKSSFLKGFNSMSDASKYLAGRMRELVGDDGKLELTTYTYHNENSSKALLAPLMDRLLPQAYSVRHRSNETIEWNDSLGPGRHQTLAISRARQAAANR